MDQYLPYFNTDTRTQICSEITYEVPIQSIEVFNVIIYLYERR